MKVFIALPFLILAITITSCRIHQSIPLKSEYLKSPYTIKSEKSYREVWSSIIDVISQNAMSFKILDQNSGLISTEKTSFINHYTNEDEAGTLINPKAWVVVSSTRIGDKPTTLTGEWNIRIKKDGNEILIEMYLANIDAYAYTYGDANVQSVRINFQAKSTGKFEELIANKVK